MVSKKEQTEQTQLQILESAFVLLKEKGIKGLTAAQIAKQAGISKSGFFHHFPKISDFFFFMMGYMFHMIEAQATESRPQTLRELLESYSATTLKMLDESPEFINAINHFIDYSRIDEEYSKRMRHFMETSIRHWVESFSSFKHQDLTEEQMTTMVYMVDAFFLGLSNQYIIMQDKQLYKNISNQFINMILNTSKGG